MDSIKIIKSYFNKGYDITLGNCYRSDRPTKKYYIDCFNDILEKNGNNVWIHPKCFKRELCNYLGDNLKQNGNYFQVCTDYAKTVPMILKAKKPGFIKDVIYYFEPSIENTKNEKQYAFKRETLYQIINKYKDKDYNKILDKIYDENKYYEKTSDLIDVCLHSHVSPHSICASQTLDDHINNILKTNIKTKSITNHNSVTDQNLFERELNKHGIKYIKGVEISTEATELEFISKTNNTNFHILGLNLSLPNKKAEDQMNQMMKKYDSYNKEMKIKRNNYICKLFSLDIDCSVDTKTFKNELIKRNVFKDTDEAKAFLQSEFIKNKFKEKYLNPKEAIDIIHEFGGKAIVAHVFRKSSKASMSIDEARIRMDYLVKLGIDGVEVFHYSNTMNNGNIDFLLNYVIKNGLLYTLGSDIHSVKDEYFDTLKTIKIDKKTLEGLYRGE